MLMLYFSGTGNSKYIAEAFSRHMEAKCHSIEEQLDFAKMIASEETIAFCYPIFGSRVPRIMREFVARHIESLKNKKVVIFCTQMMFSGDGARVFTDMFPHGYVEVIYAEHFFMPNNVNNLFFLPLASKKRTEKYIKASDKKMQKVCQNISAGIVKKRGFNIMSRGLGLIQGVFVPSWEKKLRGTVSIDNDCTKCGLCLDICPMQNFERQDEKIVPKNNCTLCYRCINKCPQKAIHVFFKAKVKRQYAGVSS
jgi:ferredoxin